MKSKIYWKEKVVNKNQKLHESSTYYPAIIIEEDGTETEALFTKKEFATPIARAARNPEDIPEKKTFWQHLFG